MKAMIFSAGLGTRLYPLTESRPKALVELNGQPLLKIIIEKLKHCGFNQFVINVHHFADQIIKYIQDNNSFGVKIDISDERNLLLDTGGGLKKAIPLLADADVILLHNVDIITNLNLEELISYHTQHNGLATLAVMQRDSSRQLLIDTNGILCGWQNNTTQQIRMSREDIKEPKPVSYCGIAVVSPEFLNQITEQGVFSIIDVYLRLAKKNNIYTYSFQPHYWFDVGCVAKLKEAEKFFS